MNTKDSNFDQEMIDLFTEAPPSEDYLPTINPWSKPIGFITWGFILTTIHLNFLYLQYALPSLGMVLIFLGFRSLREENSYFKAAWILSIFRLLYQLSNLVIRSTPLNNMDFPEIRIGLVMLALQIVMFILYHLALKKVYQKAGKVMEGNPLIWISWWTLVVALIALSSMSSTWFVFIPMMFIYIGIARSLYQIGDQLDDARYFMINAPVRINNRRFGWTYLLATFTIVIICSMFFSHLKLEAEEYSQPISIEERQHLMDMELPPDTLRHLSNEDVMMLSEAINFEVFTEALMFDPKEIEHIVYSEGYKQISHTYEPGNRNMEATTIYFEMPENLVYVLHYYVWKGGDPVWQDGITIQVDPNAEDVQLMSSGLFYRKKNMEYTAPFPRLVLGDVTVNTMFGPNNYVAISGALSYPFNSESQGGYVLSRYRAMESDDLFVTYTVFNYANNENPSYIPYERTEDLISNGAYTFSYNHQQQYTDYESLAAKEFEN